jgi:membrane protease subunit HflC
MGLIMKTKLLLLIIIAAALILARYSLFTVNEKEFVVVTRFGKPVKTLKHAGLHFKRPGFLETVNRIEKRTKVFKTQPIQLLLGDKNPLIITCYICWQISEPLTFLQSLTNSDIVEQKIGDMVNSLLGSTLGDYTIENIINVRPEMVKLEEIEAGIMAESKQKAMEKYGIKISDVGIRRLAYPEIVTQSVYNRMRAEREKEAKKYLAEGKEEAAKIEAQTYKEVARITAEANKEAQILKGQGDKEAMNIYAEAYGRDTGFFEFTKSLEACSEILRKKSTLILSTESEIFKYLKYAEETGKSSTIGK